MTRKVLVSQQQSWVDHSIPACSDSSQRVSYDAMYPRSIVGTSKLIDNWSSHSSFNWLDYQACSDWIAAASHQLTLFFREQGLRLPMSGLRFGLGAIQGRASGTLGMCFHKSLSTSHVLIAPAKMDAISLLSVLIHELLHTILPGGHTPDFKRICAQLDMIYRRQGHDLPTESMEQRMLALAKFLPQAPDRLMLQSTDLETAQSISSQWAPKLGIYCHRCGYMCTRWFSESKHQSLCPGCDELLYEIEIPADYALNDLSDELLYSKPWTGGGQDVVSFDDNTLLSEIIPIRACRIQLIRDKVLMGVLRKQVGIAWIPPYEVELRCNLVNGIKPVGWSVDHSVLDAKLGIFKNLSDGTSRYLIWGNRFKRDFIEPDLILGKTADLVVAQLIKDDAHMISTVKHPEAFLEFCQD